MPPATVTTHESPGASWEMAVGTPDSALERHVLGYWGYAERTDEPLRRREVANAHVTLIVSFGDTIEVDMSASPQASVRHRSFVAGLHAGYAITEHAGRQHGIQIDLTPLGAYRLLGVPMGALANQVVALDALRGRDVERLADQLVCASGWDGRMALLDGMLLRWMDRGLDFAPPVTWAWQQLVGSHGAVPVATLADEIGWSRRHFASRFREQIGLPPKSAARVLRFRYAISTLDAHPSIAAVAAACGYADHSHLVRDFHELAGCTPTELREARLPDAGGVAG